MAREDEIVQQARAAAVDSATRTFDQTYATWSARAESPIERLYLASAAAMHVVDQAFMCTPQVQMGPYRVDIVAMFMPALEPMQCVVVELDGHDWHERTKEQAARDKRRDRELASSGWHVLRFTGSEVYRDPHGCVEQTLTHLVEQSARARRSVVS